MTFQIVFEQYSLEFVARKLHAGVGLREFREFSQGMSGNSQGKLIHLLDMSPV